MQHDILSTKIYNSNKDFSKLFKTILTTLFIMKCIKIKSFSLVAMYYRIALSATLSTKMHNTNKYIILIYLLF